MRTDKKGFSAIVVILIVVVVLALGAGAYYLTHKSRPANQPPLSAGPIISSLMPSSGIGGTQVTITGSGFLASYDYYQSGIQTHDFGTTAVEFGPVVVNATFIDGNHMTFIVPTSSRIFGRKCGDVNCPGPVPSGNYSVWVVGGPIEKDSNSQTFTVTSAVAISGSVTSSTSTHPTISAAFPTSVTVGSVVNLTGTNFGASNAVLLNGFVAARDITSSGTLLSFVVPKLLLPSCVLPPGCPFLSIPMFLEQAVTPGTYSVSIVTNATTSNGVSLMVTTSTPPTFPGANIFSQPVIATSMENPGKYTYAFNPIPTSTGNTAMQLIFTSPQETKFIIPDNIALRLGFGYNNANERIDVEGLMQDPADSNVVFVSSMSFDPSENYNATSTNVIYAYNLKTEQLAQIYEEQPDQYRDLNFEGLQGSKLVIWFGAPGYDKPCTNWTDSPEYLELADTGTGLRTFTPTPDEITASNAEVQQCMNAINKR
jgi:hypothetical protein